MTQHTDIKAIDTELFRALMRRIASSVAVITTSYEGHLHGMTATAIASVSANPARLLIVVNRSTRSHPLITSSRTFNVNMLAETQRDLGTRFSSSSIEDQFAGVDYEIGVSGSPILNGAAAHLECRLVSETDMGSHTIFVGEIIGGALSPTTNPLLYHDGAYKRLTPRVSPGGLNPDGRGTPGATRPPAPGLPLSRSGTGPARSRGAHAAVRLPADPSPPGSAATSEPPASAGPAR